MLELGSLEFWILYYSATGVFAVVLIVYLYYMLKKPIAHIFVQKGKFLQQIGTKRLKKEWEKFDFQQKSYLIDWNATAWIDERKREHLIYLWGEAKPLSLDGLKLKISDTADKLNVLTAKNIIQQLVRGSLNQVFNQWIILILSLAAGIGIGMVLGMFVYPHIAPPPQQIINSTQTVPTIPSP